MDKFHLWSRPIRETNIDQSRSIRETNTDQSHHLAKLSPARCFPSLGSCPLNLHQYFASVSEDWTTDNKSSALNFSEKEFRANFRHLQFDICQSWSDHPFPASVRENHVHEQLEISLGDFKEEEVQMFPKDGVLCCQRHTGSSPTYQGQPQPGKT